MMNFLRKQMKWVMAVIVVAFLLSTFLMYEGRGTRRTPSRNADGTMSDYEVAKINGRSLMRSELEQRLRNYLSSYSSRNADALDMPSIYKTVLDQAVLDSQLSKEVQEKGINISDAEADQAMKLYADTYYPTRETFYQALSQSGIKVEDYKKNLARQMAIERVLNDAIGEVEVSEDKAVEFYDTMKNLIYSKPEGFMIHMADFNTSADAENFRARLVNGESWDVIVSEDNIPSKDIINITKDPVFLPSSALRTGTLTVLASLDILQPSPVFSVSSFDFAVGLKTSHVDSSLTPYNEVSADIKAMLTQQEQRKRLNDYEESLRNKAQVVINDEALFAKAPEPEKQPEATPEVTTEEVSKDEVVEESKDVADVADVTEEEEIKSEETKSEDVKVEEEVKVEEKTESSEPVAEEVVSVDSEAKPVEEAEEVKAEEVKEEEVKEAEPEVKPVETVSEEVTPEVEVKEEVKEEAVTETESKSEDVTPAEEIKEEVKSEVVEAVEEAEKIEEKVEEKIEEKVESVDESVKEAVKTVSEEIKEEIKIPETISEVLKTESSEPKAAETEIETETESEDK